MTILLLLAPASILLGLLGLGAFCWTLRSGQYEDPIGDSVRILDDRYDDAPGGPPKP
jgi:cbb3-type cytochrome oxidase maturation protein